MKLQCPLCMMATSHVTYVAWECGGVVTAARCLYIRVCVCVCMHVCVCVHVCVCSCVSVCITRANMLIFYVLQTE